MNFEDHLKDLQETYDIMMEALHDMSAKITQLKNENDKLMSEVNQLRGEINDE